MSAAREVFEDRERVYSLLMSIVPELRCIRDCAFINGQTTHIRPDSAGIQAATELLEWLGAST